MSKLESILNKRKVRSKSIDGTNYYYVQDIKDKCFEKKVDVDHIIYVDDVPLIKAEHIHEASTFDMIMKTFFDKKRTIDIIKKNKPKL